MHKTKEMGLGTSTESSSEPGIVMGVSSGEILMFEIQTLFITNTKNPENSRRDCRKEKSTLWMNQNLMARMNVVTLMVCKAIGN